MNRPPIPLRLAHRPLVGGLVVPWITLEHDGHAALGAVDAAKRHGALLHGLCQICGQRLERRIYLLLRPADVKAGYCPEPGLHPECFAYTISACPMMTGEATHYRRSSVAGTHPAGRACHTPGCPCHAGLTPAKDEQARAGRAADDWDAWMIDTAHYRPLPDPDRSGHLLGLDLDGLAPLRVRPVRRAPRPGLDDALAAMRALLGIPAPREGA